MKLSKHSLPKRERAFRLGTRAKQNLIRFTDATLGCQVTHLTEYYINFANKLRIHRGALTAVKELKQYYNIALRHAAGVTFDPMPFAKTSRSGIPKVLKPFERMLGGTYNEKRAALSVLQIFRSWIVKGDYSTDSITKPYTGKMEPDWLNVFDEILNEVFPPHEVDQRVHSLKPGIHISGKNGPNGPAIFTSHVDRKAIHGELEDKIRRFAALTGNDRLTRILDSTNDVCNMHFTSNKGKEPCTSRIAVKLEPGGKARLFAICDIFSQSALKPIHDYVMDWLRTIEEDSATDHALAAKAVSEWTARLPVWSFDLTTATDRFPIFLQERVMKAMFGNEIAELWREIISNRSFTMPDSDSNVRFECGQPLGALGSWAVFTLTHHIIVQVAARLSGHQSWFKLYRLIGDDNTIAGDNNVASRYVSCMTDLAVDFSIAKSIIPEQVIEGSSGEIAKRVFHNGIEITPIPPDAIFEGMLTPSGKKALLEIAIDRGYTMVTDPFRVQSILNKQDFAAMTLPGFGGCAPIKGVTTISEVRSDLFDIEEPPYGLSPLWWYWDTVDYQLQPYQYQWILKAFCFKEVNSAIALGEQYRAELYETAFNGSTLYTGDWNPRPEQFGLLADLISEMSRNYGAALLELYQSQEDLNPQRLKDISSKLYSVIKPMYIFKTRPMDRTKDLYNLQSRLVKTFINISKKGETSFLDYTNDTY